MSIINDALKKTHLNLKKTETKTDKKQDTRDNRDNSDIVNVYEKLHKTRQDQQNASSAHKTQGKKPSKDTPPRRAKRFGTLLIVILCFLCVSGIFFFGIRYQPAEDFFRSIKRNSFSPGPSIIQPPRENRKYKTGELILNGTSLIDGKRVALINDEIYEIGETVDGKKITSISLNKVELRDDTKIVTLKVR